MSELKKEEGSYNIQLASLSDSSLSSAQIKPNQVGVMQENSVSSHDQIDALLDEEDETEKTPTNGDKEKEKTDADAQKEESQDKEEQVDKPETEAEKDGDEPLVQEQEETTVSYEDKNKELKKVRGYHDIYELLYPNLKYEQTPVTMPIKDMIDKICDGIKDEELTTEAINEPLKKALIRCRIKNHLTKKNAHSDFEILGYI